MINYKKLVISSCFLLSTLAYASTPQDPNADTSTQQSSTPAVQPQQDSTPAVQPQQDSTPALQPQQDSTPALQPQQDSTPADTSTQQSSTPADTSTQQSSTPATQPNSTNNIDPLVENAITTIISEELPGTPPDVINSYVKIVYQQLKAEALAIGNIVEEDLINHSTQVVQDFITNPTAANFFNIVKNPGTLAVILISGYYAAQTQYSKTAYRSVQEQWEKYL